MSLATPQFTIERPELCRLLEYWQAKRRTLGRLPARADIDPLEMRFALGHLILADVEPGDPIRFRHRLIGTRIVEHAGYDATGLYVDDIPDQELARRLTESYRTVIATREPVHDRVNGMVGGRPLNLEILRLPLSQDGTTIGMVLTGAFFLKT
ncbi:MAG: histidine kinase [Tagaea sp. CACIAM 22H2]|nr:histidine kinase [Tagaea sp. CACIAM 22H2]